jgi:hypothetical protein
VDLDIGVGTFLIEDYCEVDWVEILREPNFALAW